MALHFGQFIFPPDQLLLGEFPHFYLACFVYQGNYQSQNARHFSLSAMLLFVILTMIFFYLSTALVLHTKKINLYLSLSAPYIEKKGTSMISIVKWKTEIFC